MCAGGDSAGLGWGRGSGFYMTSVQRLRGWGGRWVTFLCEGIEVVVASWMLMIMDGSD